jgi:dTDP-4-amino-4,6-dideoxygalactose transaminase
MKKYIHFAQPLFGTEEKKEVIKAMDSGWVTLGPGTKSFEEEFAKYTGAKYAVGLSSCTAALHLALIAAGVGPGDEVITTIFTFAASINPVLILGGKPVLVDIDEKTMNIDENLIEEKITKKTKVIMPMHYGGYPCNMDAIRKIAKKHKLIIIEDAATAIGASYKGKKIGNIGDMTCFSFHPIKNMSTGDGGMVTTNNQSYAERLMLLRLHGMSKEAWKRHTAAGSWKYDIVEPGFKYNMTDIQAALGRVQLKRLDGFVKTRKQYAKIFDRELAKIPEITIPVHSENSGTAYNLYTIKIDTTNLTVSRDEIVELLKQEQIGVSVYYIPLYEFSYFQKNLKLKKKDFPNAEKVYQSMMSLPLYPKMNLKDINRVIKTLSDIIKKHRK